ncbi:cupin domain-containing protein [Pelagicoccus sp. SDUM812003]|uniref:cupin domain-containing protein n=1 Tax=Pelagicoccus sp. SDUM812003 TaxID=3041267 RepID=UPI00280DEF06|nr:cupin domain-containing protein [Pelagicoccus sp. SDUM812003]MDQ8204492.1 cupin domain-containing protein [Pelagicoccus sp. SDUM812003]
MKFDIKCIIPSTATGGRLVGFEEIVAPQFGPPLHTHRQQTEIFHIIEGDFLFQRGDQQLYLSAGDSCLIPPGVVHTFKNIGDTPARHHFELLEAGNSEEFFSRIVSEFSNITDMNAFFSQYGLDLVGPPL